MLRSGLQLCNSFCSSFGSSFCSSFCNSFGNTGSVARVKKGINYRAAKANGRKLLKFYLSFERLSQGTFLLLRTLREELGKGRPKTKDTLGR